MARLADSRQPGVQLVGGDGAAVGGVGLVDHPPDALDVLARQRRDGHHRRVAHEHHAIGDALADGRLGLGTAHDVPFVQHDAHGAAALERVAGHALVLVGEPQRRVHHQEHHVGPVDGAHGPHEAVVLHVLVHLALAPQPRGVHDAVEAALVLHQGVHGVAGGARHVADDGAVVAGQLVGERALAGVGAADDGHVDGVDLVSHALAQVELAQLVHHGIQQVARAMAMQGRDGPGVAQAQAVELP